MKPGQISNKLRDALGLHSNQLPPYIYNMRLLGYPPGWLEEAKVEESNLTLFDIDGKSLKSTAKPKYGLDPNKVIDYHGFNVPPKSGFKDVSLKFVVNGLFIIKFTLYRSTCIIIRRRI